MRPFNYPSFLLFASILLAQSCGYRGGENEFEDVFGGTWNVDEINCRKDPLSPPSETYRIGPPIDLFQISFTGRSFLYSAQIGGCQTNISGVKAANYYNANEGSIGFYEVAASSGGCEAVLDELTGTVDDVIVPFGVTEAVARNMSWELREGVLEIDMPLLFEGSENGPCAQKCICSLEMSKN